MYGPLVFHTNMECVYVYLSQFTEWLPYEHLAVADIHGIHLVAPFNINSLRWVFDEDKPSRTERKRVEHFGWGAVPVLDLRAIENSEVRELAEYIDEKAFLK
jgi:UDP-galactopyranose mutase